MIAGQAKRARRVERLGLIGVAAIDGEDVVLGGEQLIGGVEPPVGVVVGHAGGPIQSGEQVGAHPEAAGLEVLIAEILVVGQPHIGRGSLDGAWIGGIDARLGQEPSAGRLIGAHLGIEGGVDPGIAGETHGGLRQTADKRRGAGRRREAGGGVGKAPGRQGVEGVLHTGRVVRAHAKDHVDPLHGRGGHGA